MSERVLMGGGGSGSKVIGSVEGLEELREELRKRHTGEEKLIKVCIGTGCAAKGSRRLYELFREAAEGSEAGVEAETKCVGCHGFCERGPIVVVEPGGIIYQGVEEPDVGEIFRESVLGGRIVERLLYEDPESGEKGVRVEEIPLRCPLMVAF